MCASRGASQNAFSVRLLCALANLYLSARRRQADHPPNIYGPFLLATGHLTNGLEDRWLPRLARENQGGNRYPAIGRRDQRFFRGVRSCREPSHIDLLTSLVGLVGPFGHLYAVPEGLQEKSWRCRQSSKRSNRSPQLFDLRKAKSGAACPSLSFDQPIPAVVSSPHHPPAIPVQPLAQFLG